MEQYFKCIDSDTNKVTFETHDEKTIYERLSSCMVARYINHAPWIKRVTSRCNYDGTYTYTFYQSYGNKYEFRVRR